MVPASSTSDIAVPLPPQLAVVMGDNAPNVAEMCFLALRAPGAGVVFAFHTLGSRNTCRRPPRCIPAYRLHTAYGLTIFLSIVEGLSPTSARGCGGPNAMQIGVCVSRPRSAWRAAGARDTRKTDEGQRELPLICLPRVRSSENGGTAP